ncbi:MAG: RNA polymerase sigma factor [Planctomycetota bacterium]|jgi:RNA polymerase sigma-70 factor (ECF subfamily)
MADDSVAALVAAIREGEVALFSEVVRRFDRAVRTVVARSVRDPDGREELVQQTFYLGFRRLDTLATPERLRAWLLSIARNCVKDYHRRRAREARLQLAWASERSPTPATWIWEEVDALAPPLAQVLRLRYQQGCTYAETAAQLEVSVATVRGRLYEARRALRQRLKEEPR